MGPPQEGLVPPSPDPTETPRDDAILSINRGEGGQRGGATLTPFWGSAPTLTPLCPPPALAPLQAPGAGTLLEGDIVRAVSWGDFRGGGDILGGGPGGVGALMAASGPPQAPS